MDRPLTGNVRDRITAFPHKRLMDRGRAVLAQRALFLQLLAKRQDTRFDRRDGPVWHLSRPGRVIRQVDPIQPLFTRSLDPKLDRAQTDFERASNFAQGPPSANRRHHFAAGALHFRGAFLDTIASGNAFVSYHTDRRLLSVH